MIAGTSAAPNPTVVQATVRRGDERLIRLTAAAGGKVTGLLQKQGRPAGVLRVAVVGGGCSGLQYKMDLQDRPQNRDIVVESAGVQVVVDPKSALYVTGSELDVSGRPARGRVQGEEPECGDQLFVRRELQRVTDHFSAMGETRRPWLDDEALRERFMRLSAALHPDRFHAAPEAERTAAGSRYAELNTAQQTLREPRRRLLHLIELETGAPPRDIQRIAPGTMDLFVEVGQECRDVDAFLEKRRAVEVPMLKVQLFRSGLEWMEKLKTLQSKVSSQGDALEADLRALNEVWIDAPPPGTPERAAKLPLARLEEIYRALSYVSRWTDQIQERLVQLSA